MIVAFVRIVREELEDELRTAEEGILNGPQDIDEYRRLVGKRQGLKSALAIIDETVKRFDDNT